MDRASIFLIDRVAPRLVFGKGPRDQPSLADLEREAQRELDERIRMGRPSPDEGRPRARPAPAPAPPPLLTPRALPVEVHAVTLDALPRLPAPNGAAVERLPERAT